MEPGPTRLATLAIALSIGSAWSAAAGEASEDALPPLDRLLDRLARVAEVYDGSALRFTAEEVTKVKNYLGGTTTPPTMHLVNVYSYYRDENGVLNDRRIRQSAARSLVRATSMEEIVRIADAAGDPMSEHAGLKGDHGVPAFLSRPYSWILLFSHTSQERYEYSVEQASRPDSVRIHFRPARDASAVDWYGSAVIDIGDMQVVRAEGLQHEDHAAQQALLRMLEAPGDLPLSVEDRTFFVRRISTDFGTEMHGLRLPSRVEIVVERHRVVGLAGNKRQKTTTAARIDQSYRNYRFYDIDLTTDFNPRRAAPESGSP